LDSQHPVTIYDGKLWNPKRVSEMLGNNSLGTISTQHKALTDTKHALSLRQ